MVCNGISQLAKHQFVHWTLKEIQHGDSQNQNLSRLVNTQSRKSGRTPCTPHFDSLAAGVFDFIKFCKCSEMLDGNEDHAEKPSERERSGGALVASRKLHGTAPVRRKLKMTHRKNIVACHIVAETTVLTTVGLSASGTSK